MKNEVLAEIIYVLKSHYKISRKEVSLFIIELLKIKNINFEDDEVIKTALDIFSLKNLDFVDCLLYAYNKERAYEVLTFDNKLNKLLSGEL